MEAAMKMAEASNSFSPVTLLNRPLERTHISRGMLKIRISVMELGRFTLRGGFRKDQFDYPPRQKGTQCTIGLRWRRTRSSAQQRPPSRARAPGAKRIFPDECVRGHVDFLLFRRRRH